MHKDFASDDVQPGELSICLHNLFLGFIECNDGHMGTRKVNPACQQSLFKACIRLNVTKKTLSYILPGMHRMVFYLVANVKVGAHSPCVVSAMLGKKTMSTVLLGSQCCFKKMYSQRLLVCWYNLYVTVSGLYF